MCAAVCVLCCADSCPTTPANKQPNQHTTVCMCSYGGLACRDLVAMARGLLEATDEAYQEYRHG